MNISIGYTGYNNVGRSGGQPVTIKGKTMGTVCEIGYDFAVSRKWAAGMQFSFISGVLRKAEYTTNGRTCTEKFDEGKHGGLGRLNISVGLRCNL